MLLTKEVEVKCNNVNKKYYLEKKYPWKPNSIITIKVQDLPKGSHADVEVLCDYCLEEGKKTIIKKPYFKYINSRKKIPKDCCDVCRGKKNREIILSKEDRFRYDYETVYNDFLDNNKILQTRHYLKVTDKLPYICIKHSDIGIQYMSYADLLRNHKECKMCKKEKIREANLLPKEEVLKIIDDKNLILADDISSYKGMRYSLDVICKKHINKGVQPIRLQQLIYGKYSCKYCFREATSGINSVKWNGGVTTLQIFLRNTISNWKKESMKKYNYKCYITGEKFHVIHHIHSFDNIFNDFIKQFNVKIFTNISEYTQDELMLYTEKFVNFHDKHGLGVCLHKSIHKLFHKTYGNKKNTKEQFEDFIIRLKLGEFNSFLEENKLKIAILERK